MRGNNSKKNLTKQINIVWQYFSFRHPQIPPWTIIPILCLLFFDLTSCTDDRPTRSRRGGSTEEVQGTSPSNPKEGLIPITQITPNMPVEQRETLCKEHSGLLKATCTYDIKSIENVFALYPNDPIINRPNEYGWTPLMWAAKNAQTDLVKLFLKQSQININLQDRVGRNALMYAVSEKTGSEEIAATLISFPGINLTLEDTWKNTAIRIAYQNGLFLTIRKLLQSGVKVNDRYLLVRACQDKLYDYVSLFLEFKANTDILNSDGLSALGEAARNGSLEIVELLLGHSADVNIIDKKSGSTPLILASKYGTYEVASSLLKHSANPNIRDKTSNKTALWYANSLDKTEIAELIRSYGGQL
ncbi:MAG: ankyrin repeat domain-containing protein [Oligoflexia bacterium]|nr:ankyrin repeat domain-containing protein [Oligoflexia bacterium]